MSQSVQRAAQVLRVLAGGPHSLAAVPEVHKSTVLRLLCSLEEVGFARRDPAGRWAVGFGLVEVGQQALRDLDLYAVARPHLLALGAEIGHTIHLAQFVDGAFVYLDKVEGRGAVLLESRIGAEVLGHTAGLAKIVMALGPEHVRRAILASADYRRYTGHTLTTPARLLAEVEAAAERGWGEDRGEYEDYINCVAVPIRDRHGEVTAGLSLTALRAILPLAELRGLVPRLTNVADRISREIGWSAPTEGTHP